MLIPAEPDVQRVMADLDLGRVQAIRHLQSRRILVERRRRDRRAVVRGGPDRRAS